MESFIETRSMDGYEAEPQDKCNVLIVFGDGRWGASLHRYLCQKHSRDFDQIVGVVDSKYQERVKEYSANLEEGTCKIEYVDFDHLSGNSEDLNRLIQEYRINWLCLAPFGETFHDPERVQFVLENFKKNRGKNVLMISSAGCESEKVPVNDLKHCENAVRVQFPTKNCILRTQILLEDLDYFARDVRKEKTWKLPTGDGSFVPVCLKEDVTFAAAVIMKSKDIEGRFSDNIFNLTGSALVNGITLAELTETAFDQRHFKFANITVDEARELIEHQRGKKQKRKLSSEYSPKYEQKAVAGEDNIKGCSRGQKGNLVSEWMGHAKNLFVGSSSSSSDAHPEEKGVSGGSIFQVGLGWLSVIERDIILNRFELVREGVMAFRTDHVQAITGHDPIAVTAYLRSHKDSFKGEE